jgi:hypothetical protein
MITYNRFDVYEMANDILHKLEEAGEIDSAVSLDFLVMLRNHTENNDRLNEEITNLTKNAIQKRSKTN